MLKTVRRPSVMAWTPKYFSVCGAADVTEFCAVVTHTPEVARLNDGEAAR